MWKKSCLTDQERFQLIKNCDEDVRITFLTSETMACSLGDIIPVLLEMRDLLEDFELTIGVLSAMANTKRFTLSLAFLTDEEKSKCRKLFTLLRKNVDLFEKSLSETGITKRLEDLQQKYIVN